MRYEHRSRLRLLAQGRYIGALCCGAILLGGCTPRSLAKIAGPETSAVVDWIEDSRKPFEVRPETLPKSMNSGDEPILVTVVDRVLRNQGLTILWHSQAPGVAKWIFPEPQCTNNRCALLEPVGTGTAELSIESCYPANEECLVRKFKLIVEDAS